MPLVTLPYWQSSGPPQGNLLAWYDIRDLAGTANLTLISSWTNRVSGGLAATGSGSTRPQYRSDIGLNGVDGTVPGLLFNPALLTITGITLGPFTVLSVLRSFGSSRIVYEHGPNAGTNPGSFLFTSTGNSTHVRRGTTSQAYDVGTNWLATNTATSVVQRYDGTTQTIRTNGTNRTLTLVAAGSPGSGTVTDTIYLGQRTGGVFPLGGQIAAFLIFNAALSDSDVALWEEYYRSAFSLY